MITRRTILRSACAAAFCGAQTVFATTKGHAAGGGSKLRLRLQWIPQAQFAGYIVAKQLGYYKELGLDVEIRPAGPDLKPQVTVAAGTDDIAIGVPNQVMMARKNGVPLKIIAQIFQDSANRYVLKKKNAISSLRDLRGKPVGLWLGGDEAEFIAMLRAANMSLRDVKVISQEFSVIPFLQDQYVLSQVTVYNELNLIEREGFGPDQLQILSPADYGSAILGDMIFTSEAVIAKKGDALVKFLTASLRGWQFAQRDPEETVKILLSYNPELKADDQRQQLAAVNRLVAAGDAASKGVGFMNPEAYATTAKVLIQSGQIKTAPKVSEMFDARFWEKVPVDVKKSYVSD